MGLLRDVGCVVTEDVYFAGLICHSIPIANICEMITF